MPDHPLNNVSYDQPDYFGQSSSYILCTAPRCGGTLLGSLLYQSNMMGVPHEYFHPEEVISDLCKRWNLPEKTEDKVYLSAIKRKRSSLNGIFGLKAHFSQLSALTKSDPFIAFLKATKCFVHVTRKDLIGQAVSYAMAHQSREWSSLHKAEATPKYDAKLISNALNDILSQNLQWQRFYAVNNVSPIEVTYEDLLEAPNQICKNICAQMGVITDHNFSIEKSPLAKQSSDLNVEWIKRFKEESRII